MIQLYILESEMIVLGGGGQCMIEEEKSIKSRDCGKKRRGSGPDGSFEVLKTWEHEGRWEWAECSQPQRLQM